MKLKWYEKGAYGIGAIGKDMVYMLSASYILYYYQDLLGVNSIAMGAILMAARVFDAFNDPIMGAVVAKTKTKWGKFRPWLMIGTILNAIILFLMFAAPPTLSGKGLVTYAAVFYILWGVTYTMMDIPYWSMVPAFTQGVKDRENLTSLARSCAGVGSALITVVTMIAVNKIGTFAMSLNVIQKLGYSATNEKNVERVGFLVFAFVIAILFIVFITITCTVIKENSTVDMDAPSLMQMFKALFQNDQTMTVVATIVLVNGSLYITSNLLIYFFKYDIGGAEWFNSYTLFNVVGGAVQIIAMMLFPLIRLALSTMKICYLSFIMAMTGYAILLVMMCLGVSNVWILLIPAFFIFMAFGFLTVLTTVFLANTVDYGELKNNRRDESVIFSMQTFVVKLASGVAILLVSICLQIFHISKDTSEVVVDAAQSAQSNLMGLRLTMTALPILGMLLALLIFRKKYILTPEKVDEIEAELKSKKAKA